jgi:hypothetical protein
MDKPVASAIALSLGCCHAEISRPITAAPGPRNGPVGISVIGDKLPAEIAISVAAQIL